MMATKNYEMTATNHHNDGHSNDAHRAVFKGRGVNGFNPPGNVGKFFCLTNDVTELYSDHQCYCDLMCCQDRRFGSSKCAKMQLRPRLCHGPRWL